MRQITNKDDKQKLIVTLETIIQYLNLTDNVYEVDIKYMLKILDKYKRKTKKL